MTPSKSGPRVTPSLSTHWTVKRHVVIPPAGRCAIRIITMCTFSRRAVSGCWCAIAGVPSRMVTPFTYGRPFATRPGRSSRIRRVPIDSAMDDWRYSRARDTAAIRLHTFGDTPSMPSSSRYNWVLGDRYFTRD